MKWLLVIPILFSPFSSYAMDVGDMAVDFSAISLDDRQVSYYADLRGKKPVYLFFWATW